MNPLGIGPAALLADLSMCINHYRLNSPGLFVLLHSAMQLGKEAQFVTSIAAIVHKGKHKQCTVDYSLNIVEGPANLVIDIIASEDGLNDLNRKPYFEQHKVKEYIIVRDTEHLTFEWNRLNGGKYETIYEDEEGLIKSSALPGLWIPVESLQNRNWWSVMAATDRGMSRKEYHDFMRTIWKS